MGNYITAK